MQHIDVVMPVRSATGREYDKLKLSCRAIRAYLPVNNLITVTNHVDPRTRERLEGLADLPLFDESAIGAGAARQIGLRHVETELYASIDSDVAISRCWWPWAEKQMLNPGVAACQGFARPVSRLCARYQTMDAVSPGTLKDLGNTLLRTSAVREVGMPELASMEDHALLERLLAKGYYWIVNPSIVSDHMISSADVLFHRYWFGRFRPEDWWSFQKYRWWLWRETIRRRERYGVSLSLFLCLANLSAALGSFVGYYSSR